MLRFYGISMRTVFRWIKAFKVGKFSVEDLFFCVEVLRPSQPNGVMSGAVSLPNHMFTGQA